MPGGPKQHLGAQPRLSLVGRVRLEDGQGSEVALSDLKVRAILAILALSPDRCRARQMLSAMLWPDRAQKQAEGSLNTDLYKIGKLFERWPGAFSRDRTVARLDETGVTVDLDEFDPKEWSRRWGRTPPRLMEDLDLDGPFEDWRREQQHAFERRFEESLSASDDLDPLYAQGWRPTEARPGVVILPMGRPGSEEDYFATLMLRETFTRCLCEHGVFDVTEDPDMQVGTEIAVDTRVCAGGVIVVLTLRDRQSGMRIWSATRQFRGPLEDFSTGTAFRLFVNELCWAIARHWSTRYVGRDAHMIDALTAVQAMFALDPERLDFADGLLVDSWDRDQRATSLAWRGYLRTFRFGERMGDDAETLREEARALTTQALEMDPSNSMVLALASHVHSFLLGNREFGHDLAERAVKLNSANPLALGYLGRSMSHFGDHEAGYALTAKAREIAGPSPFRYTLDFLCGITALLSGRTDEALRLGETALAQAPDYQAPQRYLIPLYMKAGNRTRAREILHNLRRVAPDFSLDAMRDTLPVAGIREAGLLDLGDADL